MGIVSDALAYVGKVDYVFGTNDIPGGRGDCSAFTQYIYGLHGYRIGRDTRSQLAWAEKHGVKVDADKIQPGDLVFFEGTYRAGVSHVGIATGGGKMVNLQSDGVVHEKIMSEWWKDHFMTAYRFADADDIGTAADDNDSDRDEVTNTGTGGLKSWGLDWWGDVITVVCIIGCCALALFFVYKAFAEQVKLPDIGKVIANSNPKGATE